MFFRSKNLIWMALLPLIATANTGNADDQNYILIVLAIIIGGASISYIIKKIDMPTVIGELGLGMLIAILAHYHISWWGQVPNNPTITMLAELGSILLLFEIGLESSLNDLIKVGKHGLGVAIIGVILPFLLGSFVVGEWLFNSSDFKLNLFLGATLAATSTGISVRVFKDLGILRNPACQIVLTASIIDDVLGLIILAIVSGLAISGSMNLLSIGQIMFNVVIFFILALLVARKLTPAFMRYLLKISNEESMVITLLISFCLLWSWLAHQVGLAAIIGAFVAGLILDEFIFRNSKQPHWYNKLLKVSEATDSPKAQEVIHDEILAHHHNHRLIELIKPLSYVLVPVFFVYAGMQVDLLQVASWQTLCDGILLSLAAIIGKVFCGLFLPKSINRWIVGFGMVPRGEIGLIFALTGQQLGVFNQQIFAAVLLMVVLTSLITPLALQMIVKRIPHENNVY